MRPDEVSQSAAQRIGVQRPATALTETDPSLSVCRQPATKVNRNKLLMIRLQRLVGRRLPRLAFSVVPPSHGHIAASGPIVEPDWPALQSAPNSAHYLEMEVWDTSFGSTRTDRLPGDDVCTHRDTVRRQVPVDPSRSIGMAHRNHGTGRTADNATADGYDHCADGHREVEGVGIGHSSWLLAQRPSLGAMLNPKGESRRGDPALYR